MAVALADEQVEEMRILHRAFGPWDREDAEDPELVDAIHSDIHMFAEGMDTDWVTRDLIRDFLRNHL